MQYTGVLTKMITENDQPVRYYLEMEHDILAMNQLLEKELEISFEKYQCLSCGQDKKIFRQGFCYDCFYEQPQAGDWVIRPELSQAHLGIADRDLAFEKKVQLQPHVVYLANSSEVKVGVTRKSQIPTRWIDQGAHEAIEIVEVPNRYLAGITEVALKEHISDKTNWQKMLKNDVTDEDLEAVRKSLLGFIPEEVKEFIIDKSVEVHIDFPVLQYPSKVKSLNLEKRSIYKGKLVGIKGQYLLFEGGTVFNIRNHEGFVVKMSITN